jgi:two-component system phosphate regulon sensor histidine kinase PhoR
MPRRSGVRPRSFTGRLLWWHAVAVLGVLLVLGVVADRVLEHSFVAQLTESLEADARLVQASLPQSGSLQPEILRLGQALGARITIIRTDGVVLADSEHDPATMENHLTRPEVQQALQGEVGVSSRSSVTIGIAFRYVAIPPRDGRIVRVALALTAVHAKVRSIRVILTVGFGLAALAGLAVLTFLARGLTRPLKRISASVERIGEGDLSAEVPEQGTEELVRLARTVNRMRQEVASRMAAMEEDRGAREAILSALEEGMALFGPDGAVLYQNDRVRMLLGAPVADVRSLPVVGLRTLVAAAQGGATPEPAEIVTGPSARAIRASAVRIPGEGRVLLVLRDVTRARRLDSVRRDFVANASHELKTPVASIQAIAETLVSAMGDDPAAVPRFVLQLEREAFRLSRIVSDLLDLSRLEGGTGEETEARLDGIAAEEIERLEESALAAHLLLSLSSSGPVLVTGSPRDLGLLVRNLVQNAIQYTRPGGSVRVALGAEDGEAVLSVQDTGLGIPRKDQARIFERFYRVDRARSRETGGTGLGLSIVKHVVENHGGTIEVDSELGKGSTFTVHLPLGPRQP